MSSTIAAVYLWVFTIGLVSAQPWLIISALGILILASWLVREKSGKAIWLLSAASTLMVLTSHRWPLSFAEGFDFFSGIRELAAKSVVGVSTESAALVLGLSVGDDSLVSQGLREAMQLTSLTHLMAVSGANCAIVIGAVYFLLFRFGATWRVLFSTCALIAYVLLVGAEPSVLRAATMSFAVMIALVLGRKSNPLSALSLSVLVLLAISPSLATSYGFALSVLATAGILIIAPKLYVQFVKRMPVWLAMGLAISAGAQLFCLPVLLGLQGGIPTYGLLANLICEPIVAPVTVLGLVGILFLWLPPISVIFFWLASIAAQPIVASAEFLSSLPFATLPWRLDGLGVLAAVLAVLATVLVLSAKKVATKNVSLVILVALLSSSLGVIWSQAVRISMWPIDGWQVASCDVGQGDATVVRDGGFISVIDVGRDNKKIDACLNRLGVSRIDFLVLTHFDADHVQGLTGAIRGRQVSKALITSFADERTATFQQLLNRQGIPFIKSEQGMNGVFGSVAWRVLSPSRDATEAEDSNDGSVTMLWRFGKFQLITLADLGEKGQQRLAENLSSWWIDSKLPLVMKVSHHGSADQYPEFIEWLRPKVALVSVGVGNGYGHPTKRTLNLLALTGAAVLRTDLLGSIALRNLSGEFEVSYSGSS